ncbi:glycosyltransferase family 2 protein [Pseudotamlana haliotis]|nr:glycosyltransferase family A protein [Tamlana haliotis]
MSDAPFFSIIIPLYNKAHHIKSTIESALDQTFEDFEIIVVNDGSTDGSESQVQAISDERITLHTKQNQGVAFARNFGVEKARAERIVFLDADDSWYPTHLEDLKALFLEYPDCGLYCKAYYKKEGKSLNPSKYNNLPTAPNWKGIVKDYFDASIVNCVAWTSAVAMPKAVFNNLNGFDTKITMGAGEDIDLWMRAALKYPVAFHNTPTAIHHLDATNRISHSNTNLRRFINLDQYDAYAKTNKSLKKYLDYNRFAFAIQYKLAKNFEQFEAYRDKIDMSNLNNKQIFLLNSNRLTLVLFSRLKHTLNLLNIRLSAFN